jgi:hypothetical protein
VGAAEVELEEGWWFEDHAAAITDAYTNKARLEAIRNYGPQPRQRYMERGNSYRQATLLTNEVYRGLVAGIAYDVCIRRAVARPDFGALGT